MGRRDNTQATARRGGDGEAGFTIIESTLALGVMFAVLVGLLATLAGTSKAIVSSKQRNAAVALAGEVMEQSRGFAYASVGHDLAGDSGLAADPATVGVAPDLTFEGEPLVGSNKAGGNAPFAPHHLSRTVDATTFDVRTYVTLVTPAVNEAVGMPYKRITVTVTWDRAQYSHEGSNDVRIESFLYDAEEPPDPLLLGMANADAGIVQVTGDLQGVDLNEALYWFPTAHGEIDSRFIRRVKGFATSPRSLLSLNTPVDLVNDDNLSAPGCIVLPDKKGAECSGTKAESVADNDAGTAPAVHDVQGPFTAGGGVARRRGSDNFMLSLETGDGNMAASKSSAMAYLPAFHADTNLPFHASEGTGPSSVALKFATQSVSGALVAAGGPASARATVERSDDGDSTIRSWTRVTHPALDVFRLDGTVVDDAFLPIPGGWHGLVRLGSSTIEAEATAGPGAPAPVPPSGSVGLSVFTPRPPDWEEGDPYEPYTSYTLPVGDEVALAVGTEADPIVVRTGDRRVAMNAVVTTARTVVSSDPDGATMRSAEVSLKVWLRVEARIRVWHGDTLRADLHVDVDYGRLLASALYEPTT